MKTAEDYPYFQTPFACMAHRGGYIENENADRENSLFAFKSAVEIGYRYIETDVHATADGYLIAFHDDRLDRVTDSSGIIADLPFDYVREAKIAGKDQIPTLDEVFEELPDVFVNIDIKAEGAIKPLVETIKRHNAYDRVCVASFSEKRLSKFRALMGPRVATSMSTSAVAYAVAVPVLPKKTNLAGLAFQIPVKYRIGPVTVKVLSKRLLKMAHQRGMKVHVWTVNDAEQMRKLIDFGVDGIITDRPAVLKRVALEKGVWQG